MLTTEQIVTQYLFGTTTKPANLEDADLIRPDEITTLDIDAAEYMETGPGRFAKLSMVPLVQTFFNTGLLAPTGQRQEFTFDQLRAITGTGTDIFGNNGSDRFRLQQVNYDDGQDDAIARAFAWNSTSFVLRPDTFRDGVATNDVKFVIEADGTRYIENAQLQPFDANFDFESDNIFSRITNYVSKQRVDPSGIGRTVDLKMTNKENAPVVSLYTRGDFNNDLAQSALDYVNSVVGVESGLAYLRKLFDDGVTSFIVDGKAVIYADNDGGLVDPSDKMNSYHESAATNGIVFVGSDLDDAVEGTQNDDRLFGWDGDDELEGSDGNDELFGGEGNDILQGGKGEDVLRGMEGDDNIDGGSPDGQSGDDAADRIEGGSGYDTISIHAGEAYGQAGNDTITIHGSGTAGSSGDAQTVRAYGGSGNDTLDARGSTGEHFLSGGSGDDVLYGNGESTINSGSGADTIYLETGDTLADRPTSEDKLYINGVRIAGVLPTENNHGTVRPAEGDGFFGDTKVRAMYS